MMKKVAISVGDPGGIGLELALRFHETISRLGEPLYLVDRQTLEEAADLLRMEPPRNFTCLAPDAPACTIRPGTVDAEAGAYSFASFKAAVELTAEGHADALCTLPIHKKAWELAGLPYRGHTDALRDFFSADAIMMLGCEEMFVGLYTEHIPLREVPGSLDEKRLTRFLLDFRSETGAEKIAVLGLNPHAGDHGVLGDEERIVEAAVEAANRHAAPAQPFVGPLVPDTAFIPPMRKAFTHYAALYHDQGLIPLKALHFDESINVSLNLPILRTSVDHGTAFDIAYGRGPAPRGTSYINAIRYAVRHGK